MRSLAFMIMFLGFLPSFLTASQTEEYLTMFDYVCAFGGFYLGCLIWELRYER